MSAETPRGYPFPTDDQRPDIPADIAALAAEIDRGLRRAASGRTTLALSGANTAAQNVTVPDHLAPGDFHPVATAEHSSGNYVATITHVETAESGGPLTFRVRVNHLTGANATTTVYVRWVATER